MARKREQRITESGAELRELAGRYAGKAQEGRLLFLAWLKETPGSTIGQAARAAGLSERQGRYLWDDYCAGGVERVIGRRVYQPKGEKKPERAAAVPAAGTVAGMTAADMVAFMKVIEELENVNDPAEWGSLLKSYLMEFIPEVDYAVVSLNHNSGAGSDNTLRFIRNILPEGVQKDIIEPIGRFSSTETHRAIIENGKQLGFPFQLYHFPPVGLDLHSGRDGNKKILGAILLFREISKRDFSSETLDLVQRLIPFFSLLLSEYQYRAFSVKPGADFLNQAITIVARDIELTNREMDILMLLFLGHTHDEIAALLNVTRSTVNKHTRSVFRKAGVRRLSEFFARYFTPRNYFPEPENRGADEGSGVEE